MTSGAHPCMPAAPFGAEEARISRRTTSGLRRAISWATKEPIENPRRSTRSKFMALRKASASWAIWPTELGVVPVVIPTPTLSKATIRREEASASTSAGSQLSRFPRKCWRRTTGTAPVPDLSIGVVDAARGTDDVVRRFRISGHRSCTVDMLLPLFVAPLPTPTTRFSLQVGWQASAACSMRSTTASG